jgi:hypothetical protein
MSSAIAPHWRPSSRPAAASRYERVWTTVALLAASVWVAVAILQTPRLPLLVLAGALGAIGGMLFVQAPASTPRGRQQYVAGASAVAVLVLVTVGIGHHLALGLATVAVMAGSSPSVVRWLAGR